MKDERTDASSSLAHIDCEKKRAKSAEPHTKGTGPEMSDDGLVNLVQRIGNELHLASKMQM